MSETHEIVASGPLFSAKVRSAKNNAIIGYAAMLIGLITGVFWFVGGVWAIFKKHEAANTIFEDHYTNIIKTFWWGLSLFIIGVLLSFFGVGYFILLGVFIWSIYRIIKGLSKITSNKAFNS